MQDTGSFNVAVLCVCSVFFRELIYCLSTLMKNVLQIPLHIPLPHRDAFKAFANRADPDQAALVRAA